MLRWLPIVSLLLFGFLVSGSAVRGQAVDPWEGKGRAELEQLLGPASKVKRARSGEITLVYKLVRLAEDLTPPADVLVFHVRGVGLVGRSTGGGALDSGSIAIEPVEIDPRGRSTGGGVSEQESASISWNSETGDKTVRSTGEDRRAVLGKLTLRFVVDGSGTIRSWSASPKEAARGS